MTITQISGKAEEFARAAIAAGVSKKNCLYMVETAIAVESIKWAKGNKSRAARRLHLHRNLLDYWVRKLHLKRIVEAAKSGEKQIELFPPKKSARSETGRGLRRAA